jgi:hypothetical protein
MCWLISREGSCVWMFQWNGRNLEGWNGHRRSRQQNPSGRKACPGMLITIVALSWTVHACCLRPEEGSKATGSHSLHVPTRTETYVIPQAPLSRPKRNSVLARSDTAELAGFVVLAGMPFAEAEPCRDPGRILENKQKSNPLWRWPFPVLGRQDCVVSVG